VWWAFLKDCTIKIGATAGLLKGVSWLLGHDKELAALLASVWPITVMTIVGWCTWYYLAYYEEEARERAAYARGLERASQRGHAN
jgi:hypothetical protein